MLIQPYRADDLIPEESEIMQRAMKRLSPKEAYDRVFRMRRAFQVCFEHLARLQPGPQANGPHSARFPTNCYQRRNGQRLRRYAPPSYRQTGTVHCCCSE
jgi:hypothetical protein